MIFIGKISKGHNSIKNVGGVLSGHDFYRKNFKGA